MTLEGFSIDGIRLLGGLGLFLYAVRSLTQSVQRSLSRRARGALAHTLASPARCLLFGFLATIVVQASSITVIAAMGMVGASLITLEQGFLLVLGASLGTTVKIWFVSAEILKVGPVLVGLASLLMVFTRRLPQRELLQGITAVGFALWGMLLLQQGLELIHNRPEVQDFLQTHPGDRLYHQLVGVVIGAVLATVLQSSSTVVFLVVSVAGKGNLQFPEAVAMILGANIGTTMIPILASIENNRTMRRLALAYAFVKFTGVAVALFFFPQVIALVTALVPDHWSQALHLAAVHSGFNLVNMLCWFLLSGLMVRWVERVMPSVEGLADLSLAPVVRRILARSPERSLNEAQRQLGLSALRVKAVLDRCLALLRESTPGYRRFETSLLEQREFEGLKEGTYELLAQACRAGESGETLRPLMRQLVFYDELFQQAWRLRELLEYGQEREGWEMPDSFTPWLDELPATLDAYWLKILFPEKAPPPAQMSSLLVARLEERFLFELGQGNNGSDWEISLWTFDVVNSLREVLSRLDSGLPPHESAQAPLIGVPAASLATSARAGTTESSSSQESAE